MSAINDEPQEQNTMTEDGSKYLLDTDDDPEEPETVETGPPFTIEVAKTTATDDDTGEQYTLWRATGRPSGVSVDAAADVSPHLPEAVMSVCETLERHYGGGL